MKTINSAKIKCPYCDNLTNTMYDSREIEDGTIVRRRRKCKKCGRNFKTFEEVKL